MTFIGKDKCHYTFDRDQPPAVTVKPGTEVTFETSDACHGHVRSVADLFKYRAVVQSGNPMAGSGPSDPFTGPVFIEGAKPGQTLTVDILKIELDAEGFQLIGPNRAIVVDEVPDWTCYVFRAEKGQLVFPNGISLPADPLIGAFGTAPAAGKPTNCPGLLGGDIDCPFVREGARIHLPVEVEGALFSLGDIHARQGDGEVVGAPEIGAKVTVRLGLTPGRIAEGFMIEDAENWHACRTAENEGEAARQAVFQNGRFLSGKYGLEFRDALILLTMIGRLSIARTAKWGPINPMVCSSFSKQAAEAALRGRKT